MLTAAVPKEDFPKTFAAHVSALNEIRELASSKDVFEQLGQSPDPKRTLTDEAQVCHSAEERVF